MSMYEHFSPGIKARLDSMYRNEPQIGKDGCPFQIDHCTRIYQAAGMDIYDICMNAKATQTLEIGLAYGFSTLFFLESHMHNKGTHTAIDPAQSGYWGGVGVVNADQFKLGPDKFKFHEGMSYDVLPVLKNEHKAYDVIFIDGNHRFDDVLVDFILAVNICKINGYIILDDALMPSISKVISFIKNNRHDFEVVSLKSSNLAAFKRISHHDNRKWDYHIEF